jgi:hypothetical protein
MDGERQNNNLRSASGEIDRYGKQYESLYNAHLPDFQLKTPNRKKFLREPYEDNRQKISSDLSIKGNDLPTNSPRPNLPLRAVSDLANYPIYIPE